MSKTFTLIYCCKIKPNKVNSLHITTPLDHDVLHSLKLQGYTVLVAENQTKLDWYIFTPKKWDLDAFIGDAVMHGFDNQEIITINEALKLNLEDLMNHQVIIGGEMQ